MSFLKSLMSWESKAAASAATDLKLIELQAKRLRLLFESLKKQGFTEDQAVQLVAGISRQPQWLIYIEK